MNREFLTRLLVCIIALGAFLYAYIDLQNTVTALKMDLPILMKELDILNEENEELTLAIERLENPFKLFKLLNMQEFSHLHFPYDDEVIILK